MTLDSDHDFDTVLDAHPIRSFQILIAVLSGIIAIVDGFDTQIIALIAPQISQQWHVPIASFGVVFSIGLFGAVTGMAIFGTIGDRIGRKPILLISMTMFGVISLATPLANSLGALMAFRFATGLGLGGAIPMIVATVAEYTPVRMRTTAVSLAFCGFPLGIVVASAVTPGLMKAFDWPVMFVIGGAIPLLLLPILAAVYPESVRVLVAKHRHAAFDKVIKRLDIAGLGSRDVTMRDSAPRTPVRTLFSDGRATGTLLLWTTLFLSLMLAYFLNSWVAIVAQAAGFDGATAIFGVAMLNLGGILGCFALGRLSDRYHASAVLGAGYLIGAVAIAAIGQVGGSGVLLLGTALVAGFFTLGAQLCTIPMSANFYPAAERATGVGWCTGVGRIGGIIGPSVGGALVGAGFAAPAIFAFAGTVSLAAALAVFAMGWFVVRTRADSAPKHPVVSLQPEPD
jgi:AAHS family 4-hydroxybenzoate transporter-like MFS transporter